MKYASAQADLFSAKCVDCKAPASTGLWVSTGGADPTCDACEVERLGLQILILYPGDTEEEKAHLLELATEHERVRARIDAV